MIVDFLIIGQGLAGSLLALELIQRGRKVIIVDNGRENASQIAAGLINPVTGIRLAKSANVDTLLPVAMRYYERLAVFFRQQFYVEKPLLRIFTTHDEFHTGRNRVAQVAYQSYLGKIHEPGSHFQGLATPFGCLEQKQTGYLLTRPLLTELKNFFIAENCYQSGDFDYRDIRFGPVLSWRNIVPKQIIFCEGYHANNNPWFKQLPWQAVKGEILTVTHRCGMPNKILNFGHWLIPLRPEQSRIGASFERGQANTEITEQARLALLQSVNGVIPQLQPRAIAQQAGIRPCTQDRRPFLGRHPYYPQLAIFNGFGAKGSLQIPWYAQHFADALVQGAPLLDHCDIRRHETCFTG